MDIYDLGRQRSGARHGSLSEIGMKEFGSIRYFANAERKVGSQLCFGLPGNPCSALATSPKCRFCVEFIRKSELQILGCEFSDGTSQKSSCWTRKKLARKRSNKLFPHISYFD